ncbi:MAG: DUF2281 domain-containing protein [Candidatus Aminicenantes bacterium]|nr:DUF2281 domain-containing protein [Candidatus Aminicenantes bacterium]
MIEEKIDITIQELPVHLKREVLDYAEFLVNKYKLKRKKAVKKTFKFDWEGGLADIKDKTTSVELQHNASGWR